MSQERLKPDQDIPGPWRWRLALVMGGIPLVARNRITSHGREIVPRHGKAMSISNHRSDNKDVRAVGWELSRIRKPLIPAKAELDVGFKGKVMRGSGALFFDRDDSASRKAVLDEMRQGLIDEHYLHIFIEETSQNKGEGLGNLSPSPVMLAAETGLKSMIMIGIGGTEDPESSRIHLEFADLPLAGLRQLIEARNELLQKGHHVTIKEAAHILADTENVELVSDETLFAIANPDPSLRRGQTRKRHIVKNPETANVDRMMLYQIFTEQVVRQKLQDLVGIAYAEAAIRKTGRFGR